MFYIYFSILNDYNCTILLIFKLSFFFYIVTKEKEKENKKKTQRRYIYIYMHIYVIFQKYIKIYSIIHTMLIKIDVKSIQCVYKAQTV